MIDIKLIIKSLINNKNLQAWHNSQCSRLHYDHIDYFPSLVTPDGITIGTYPHSYDMWKNVFEEYRFDDISRDDIVLDIGANIGAFALRAAMYSINVHAIEPLWTDVLQINVFKNPHLADRITIHNLALGNGERIKLTYDNREKIVETIPLINLIKQIGGCDFLKFDTEGAEWLINPNDLKGIPRIEMEIHQRHQSHFMENDVLIPFLLSNWKCIVNEKEKPNIGKYIHCYPKSSF